MNDKEKIHNMASCMLSVLDSIKLYDKGQLVLDNETLSEVMFRKMKAYNIDLNKELGFEHLSPVKKTNKKSKEELILKVINDGKNSLNRTKKNHEKMIREYQKNGLGDMHPNNIEGYKSGLHYTLGYTIGHLELLKLVNNLINMTPCQIKDLIKDNNKIERRNKKYLDELFKKIRNKMI